MMKKRWFMTSWELPLEPRTRPWPRMTMIRDRGIRTLSKSQDSLPILNNRDPVLQDLRDQWAVQRCDQLYRWDLRKELMMEMWYRNMPKFSLKRSHLPHEHWKRTECRDWVSISTTINHRQRGPKLLHLHSQEWKRVRRSQKKLEFPRNRNQEPENWAIRKKEM